MTTGASARVGVLVSLLAVLAAAETATAAAAGPRLTEPRGDRLAALRCYGSPAHSPRPPVLLVTGTILTPEEAWSWGYQRVLLERGHAVCTVRLPEFGFGDAQRTVEYVVTAIREVGRRSARKLSVVGVSQGGFQPLLALRVWPRTARQVEDFVGLAGVYDRGSLWARKELDASARTPESRPYCSDACVPWFAQMAAGSKLLTEVGKRELPGGPDYTAIGTLYDEAVTPQPEANELPHANKKRSMQIQDVCPGRRFVMNHGGMLADRVAHALVLDALDHPGPAEPIRIPATVCLGVGYDGIDWARLATDVATAGIRSADPGQQVTVEPPLRCNLDPRCQDPGSWAVPLLDSARLAPRTIRAVRHCRSGCLRSPTAVLRVHARRPGRLTLRIRRLREDRAVGRALRPALPVREGARSIRFGARVCHGRRVRRRRCRRLPPGDYRLDLYTRPLDRGYWTRERTLRLRLTHR